MKKLVFPLTMETELALRDEIEIWGKIFCGRDAALPKLARLYELGMLEQAGIDLKGALIFHTAVSPAGVGPTSSNKPDIEQSIPALSRAGVRLHLGKGALRPETVAALAENRSYFAVTPPVTALFASRIISRRIVAFAEEGMEALYELEVNGLPAIVACAGGSSIFEGR